MKGTNRLGVCEAEMVEIVQTYLREHLFKNDMPIVVSHVGWDGAGRQFEIKFELEAQKQNEAEEVWQHE